MIVTQKVQIHLQIRVSLNRSVLRTIRATSNASSNLFLTICCSWRVFLATFVKPFQSFTVFYKTYQVLCFFDLRKDNTN